jgi:hypothetical protein
MAQKLKDIVVQEVSLVSAGANKKRFYVMKSLQSQEASVEEEVKDPVIEKAAEPVEEVVEAPVVEAAPAVEVSKAEESQVESVSKAEIASLRKAVEESKARQVELQKALDGEREAREVKEAVLKHAESFKNLPAKAEELAPALRTLAKAAPEAAALVEKVLKSVDALLGASGSALEPIGKSLEPVEESSSEKLERLVADIRKRQPDLSEAKAYVLALEQHPELY